MSIERKGDIRVGVGGWTYPPWRGTFYPVGLPQKRELEFAGSQLTSIEINGTYYGSQKPESFAKWHDETPGDFVFSLKAPRFATNRKVLAEAGASIERFLTGGMLELKDKLGPINWQFLPAKTFDPVDFEAFLKLLPGSHEGRALRHVVEVRNDSFNVPEFTEMLRAHGVAAVVAGDAEHPQIADPTAPFVYARIMGTIEAEPMGYGDPVLDLWVERARSWAAGGRPDGMDYVGAETSVVPRDVFLYVISGYKARNPQAAMALIGKLSAADGRRDD